ncbi:MAG: response regulator [Candidatus Palauibacterales bacterium]|nr:response regulator [Candidatus Palauibacterales bacterium]MDP2530984.1 response regulator [Candidatus Palauibacterales bacterium]MDP2583427.1 response regulator [Candidatus Palauibacterales bacterium]
MNSSPNPRQEPQARPGRILVADDNEDCRIALRTYLEAHGYEVFEAADGESAVQLTLRERPDLVLMDVMMPGVDGLEAARRIRALDDADLSSIRIVALSAMEGARQASAAARCDDCILKPIDLAAFAAMIEGWLQLD